MTPKSKQKSEHPASFGKGGPSHMFSPQAAGRATAGRTGKIQSPAPGKRAAAGGPPTRGASLSKPAAAGQTGPRKGR
jgi:hypothetical protein